MSEYTEITMTEKEKYTRTQIMLYVIILLGIISSIIGRQYVYHLYSFTNSTVTIEDGHNVIKTYSGVLNKDKSTIKLKNGDVVKFETGMGYTSYVSEVTK